VCQAYCISLLQNRLSTVAGAFVCSCPWWPHNLVLWAFACHVWVMWYTKTNRRLKYLICWRRPERRQNQHGCRRVIVTLPTWQLQCNQSRMPWYIYVYICGLVGFTTNDFTRNIAELCQLGDDRLDQNSIVSLPRTCGRYESALLRAMTSMHHCTWTSRCMRRKWTAT